MPAFSTDVDLALDHVVLLNAEHEPIGEVPRREVHGRRTPLHLAFSLYVLNDRGETLITRRALGKLTWPGVWTNTCCGHPRPGESLPTAIRRRLGDELGLEVSNLECVLPDFAYRATDASGIEENEVCPVFAARPLHPSARLLPNPDEVLDWKWVRWTDITEAARRIAATGRRVQAAGGAVRTKVRDRSRAAGKRAHDLNAKLRTRNAAAKEEALEVVRRKNAELADLAETAAADAERLLANAKRALRAARQKAAALKAAGGHDAAAGRRRGRLARAVDDLTELLDATRQIAAQTRQRVAGVTPDGATRRVSLHDPDARPIAKGRLGKPVEFGTKAQVCDNDDGIVLDHDVQPGNPADAPRLEPSIQRVKKRTGRTPRTVTADRGYGEQAVDDALHEAGIRDVVIPRKGRPTKTQQSRGTPTSVPPTREMAHRLRRQNQHPETRLRLGPQPDRHPRRRKNLGRTRSPRPQPDQNQRPGQLTPAPGTPTPPDRC